MIDNAEITFGDNIYIGANCCFCTAERPVDAETRNSGLERAKPIRVGNNVSFGNNVTVAAGITIGDNVVIGPGSAVTKDVPSNCKAFGNPCLPTKVLQESSKSSFEKKTEDKPAAPASAAAPAQNRPGAPTAPQQNRPAAPASPSMPSLNRPADPAAPQQNRPGAPTAPQQNRPMGTRHIEVRRVEPTNNNNNSNNNNNNNGFPDRRK